MHTITLKSSFLLIDIYEYLRYEDALAADYTECFVSASFNCTMSCKDMHFLLRPCLCKHAVTMGKNRNSYLTTFTTKRDLATTYRWDFIMSSWGTGAHTYTPKTHKKQSTVRFSNNPDCLSRQYQCQQPAQYTECAWDGQYAQQRPLLYIYLYIFFIEEWGD